MLDSVSFGELAVIAVVALIVIGPKDLPRAMHFVGKWVGKARAISRQFRSHVDDLVRNAEMEEMERKWREQNEQIMRAHPAPPQGRVDPDRWHPEGQALPLAEPVNDQAAPPWSTDAGGAALPLAGRAQSAGGGGEIGEARADPGGMPEGAERPAAGAPDRPVELP